MADLLIRLIPGLSCPKSFVDHMTGTNRALGASFTNIFIRNGELKPDEASALSRLFVLCRAAIVVDDAIRDCDPVPMTPDDLRMLRDKLFHSCGEALFPFIGSKSKSKELLLKRKLQMDEAYRTINEGTCPSVDIIFGKCSLVGLPFDAIAHKLGDNEAKLRQHQAVGMLFLLQLADDFADRHSDTPYERKSNLLTWESDNVFSDELLCLYAMLAINRVAEDLLTYSVAGSSVHTWLGCVLDFCRSNVDSTCLDFSRSLFPSTMPAGYLPPSANPYLVHNIIDEIQIKSHIVPELRAEYLHSLATTIALSRL